MDPRDPSTPFGSHLDTLYRRHLARPICDPPQLTETHLRLLALEDAVAELWGRREVNRAADVEDAASGKLDGNELLDAFETTRGWAVLTGGDEIEPSLHGFFPDKATAHAFSALKDPERPDRDPFFEATVLPAILSENGIIVSKYYDIDTPQKLERRVRDLMAERERSNHAFAQGARSRLSASELRAIGDAVDILEHISRGGEIGPGDDVLLAKATPVLRAIAGKGA